LDWITGQIPAGAILIIDPDRNIAQGSIVLIIKANGTPVLAQVFENKGGLIYSGLNERQIYKVNSKTKCIGVVSEWRISEKL
jgi:hypothetical protein